MHPSPRAVAVGVDLGSWTTTVSTRRGDDRSDVRQSATGRADADDPEPIRAAEHDDAEAPVLVGLTVPATWSSTRRRAHAEAAANAGFDASFLVLEPEAAARHFAEAQGRPPGPEEPLAVCNLGAASCHVAVVRRMDDRYRVEAAKSADDIGGRAFDQLLLDHLADRFRHTDAEYWSRIRNPGETTLRARALEEVRRARERLSEHPSVTVAPPGLERELRLTRTDAEQCLTPAVLRIVSLVEEVLREAEVETDQVSALLLIGGVSRTPLIASVIGHHLDLDPVRPELPDLVLAEGAALAGLARIDEDAPVEEPVAPVRVGPLKTSPDVLVTMAVVALAVAAIVGVALIGRDDSGPQDLDVDGGIPSAPNLAGGPEPEEAEPSETEDGPAGDSASPEPSAPEEGASGEPSSPVPETTAPASTTAPSTQETSASQATEAVVPNVVGESAADAERILTEAGFTNVVVEGERQGSGGPDFKSCEITAQSPQGGSRRPLDEPIVVEYAYVGNDNC